MSFFEFLQTATTPETFFCFSLEVIKSHENTPQFAHRPGNLCCCKMLREQSGLGSKNTPETNVYIIYCNIVIIYIYILTMYIVPDLKIEYQKSLA